MKMCDSNNCRNVAVISVDYQEVETYMAMGRLTTSTVREGVFSLCEDCKLRFAKNMKKPAFNLCLTPSNIAMAKKIKQEEGWNQP